MSNNRKTAVVTGSAQGIGLAVARRLGVDGYRVLMADQDGRALAAAANSLIDEGLDVAFLVLDVGDISAVETTLPAWIEAQTGGVLDTLVNNAGFGMEKAFYETSSQEWRRLIDVDLTGPFLLARTCWPFLRKPGGTIVNISSVHGSRPLPGQAAYAAAKGGLNNLTKVMAMDGGPYGVRANAVMPGFITTRLWHGWMNSAKDKAAEHRKDVAATVPLGRPGTPEEVAAAVAWLASDEASYISGSLLEVDGGLLSRACVLPSMLGRDVNEETAE